MGSCLWFKTLISLRRKDGRSKQVKVHSDAKKSNGPKWRCLTGKESISLSISASRRDVNMPTENIAAMRIQTAFRAYMARKGLRRRKGTVRFQALIGGHTVQKQASAALDYIHGWSKIQAEIRARRLSMVTEGRTRQKKVENQLKLDAKLHELEVEWCGGSETMEEILARIQQREEATVKRERAMAYAFSHQWRANSNLYFGQAYYDLGKEGWGWSWMERWIAVCPWEIRVHAQPTVPKKVNVMQGGNVGKITNQVATKILVPVKPHMSNGKGGTKASTLSSLTAEKQASQDGK